MDESALVCAQTFPKLEHLTWKDSYEKCRSHKPWGERGQKVMRRVCYKLKMWIILDGPLCVMAI